MPSLRDNDVQVKVSTKADTKGIKDTEDALKKLSGVSSATSGAMKTLGGVALKVGEAVAAVATTTAAAALAATTFAVKSAADFEQTRIGLENMLGSANSARKVLSEVSKFAADTPFEFPELATSVKQLVAFGFSGQDAVSTMKQLGDVSAAVGTPMGDLTYLMGTLRTQGRAFTIDIRQFAQRGIPIYEYLAKVLKTDEASLTDMITAGKVGFPEVQKAFQLMTSEGGKFHGTMEKQSQSLAGVWSTLQDNIGAAAREIAGINQSGDIRKNSIFDFLKKGVSGLNDVLGKVNWANEVKTATNFLGGMFNKVKEVATAVGNYLVPKIKDLFVSFGRVWEAIRPLLPIIGATLVFAIGALVDAITFLNNGASFLIPVIGGVTAAMIAFNVALGVSNAIKSATTAMAALNLVMAANPISLVVAAVAGLASGIALLIGITSQQTTESISLKTAQENLKTATDNLKRSEDDLRNARLDKEGANIQLQRAEERLKSLRDSGAASALDLKEAEYQVKRAKEEVKKAAENEKKAIDNAKKAKDSEVKAKDDVIKANDEIARSAQAVANSYGNVAYQINQAVTAVRNAGGSVSDQFVAGLNASVQLPGHAIGANNYSGGYTWTGENGPELVKLPRGSQIMTHKQSMNMDGSGNTVTFTGNLIFNSAAAVDRFFDKLDQDNILSANNMATNRGTI